MAYRSELNKLARIQVDIPSSMDKEWILDVKKSSAKIPDKLKNRIKIALKDTEIDKVWDSAYSKVYNVQKIYDECNNSISKKVEVLIEKNEGSKSFGYSKEYIYIEVEGNYPCGEIINVQIESVINDRVVGVCC